MSYYFINGKWAGIFIFVDQSIAFMKSIFQLFFLLLATTALHAQQYYFAYVQTDNKQPFYVKVNDKLLSSSASGYVVIPKLITGNYTVTFGFPKEQFPQQTINLNIAAADAGFLLKDFGAKGWGLFNLETMQVAMNNTAGNSTTATAVANDDVFSNTLSGVANTDLSVPKKPVTVVVPETKPVIVKVEEKVSSPATINAIKKINSSSDVDGKSYTYVDNTGAQNDTINVFIAANKIASPSEPVKEVFIVKEEEPIVKETKVIVKEDKPAKFLDIDMDKPAANNSVPVTATKPLQAASTTSITKPDTEKKDKPIVNFNSDCKAMADDNAFLKLRKKMAALSSDDAMLDAAKKTFKNTCFSVEQVKNLSALFLNDTGKYIFFDAAYPHVYDSQNFGTLLNILTDQYYISRFKAMIRN